MSGVEAPLPIAEILVVLFGAGGILGGLVALFKAKPERNKIIIDSAQGAVVIQSNVLDEVNAAYENVLRENRALHERMDEFDGLKSEVKQLTEENAELTRENATLRNDNAELRGEVKTLTDRVKRLEGSGTPD
jgi:septal ring factor EnvC (AmiA/AmiB activator)